MFMEKGFTVKLEITSSTSVLNLFLKDVLSSWCLLMYGRLDGKVDGKELLSKSVNNLDSSPAHNSHLSKGDSSERFTRWVAPQSLLFVYCSVRALDLVPY